MKPTLKLRIGGTAVPAAGKRHSSPRRRSCSIGPAARRMARRRGAGEDPRFLQLAELMPDAIFVAVRGCFAYVNPAGVRLFGARRADDLVGRRVAERFAPKERFEHRIESRAGAAQATDVYLKLDGTPVEVEARAMPIVFDGERGTLALVRDAAVHRRGERLEEALRELQATNAALTKRVEDETAKARHNEHLMIDQARRAAMGEMVGDIAHQWRQPLSTLGLLIQNLRYDFAEGSLGAAEFGDYVDRALRAIDRMSTTIDDFRDFFKPDRRPEAYSPVAAVEGCLDLVGASLKANNIALSVSGPRELKLFGYPSEFAQIMLNLISNAKDAFVERRITPGTIDVAVVFEDDEVTVAVRDNAGGIRPDHLVKIFDPYFTTKDKGAGIGLYMARTIVEQHMGGAIRAKNTGDGALFVLCLPRRLAANEPPWTGRSQPN